MSLAKILGRQFNLSARLNDYEIASVLEDYAICARNRTELSSKETSADPYQVLMEAKSRIVDNCEKVYGRPSLRVRKSTEDPTS